MRRRRRKTAVAVLYGCTVCTIHRSWLLAGKVGVGRVRRLRCDAFVDRSGLEVSMYSIHLSVWPICTAHLESVRTSFPHSFRRSFHSIVQSIISQWARLCKYGPVVSVYEHHLESSYSRWMCTTRLLCSASMRQQQQQKKKKKTRGTCEWTISSQPRSNANRFEVAVKESRQASRERRRVEGSKGRKSCLIEQEEDPCPACCACCFLLPPPTSSRVTVRSLPCPPPPPPSFSSSSSSSSPTHLTPLSHFFYFFLSSLFPPSFSASCAASVFLSLQNTQYPLCT
ncbi:hypothetical protein BZA05DRAFT_214829 [Tricharina praecox]|uniref:uncharacterized protein n=1 Tax=Tricharina praecox TaxID=43433 RepID=UPI002220B2B3|nr:uncharacterized protein BZA05DRAFT_214829 [Tricharina praecox]KAI5855665.1 hypothetical protein BZA05DRAFT_214829 [Tricharina praecox]